MWLRMLVKSFTMELLFTRRKYSSYSKFALLVIIVTFLLLCTILTLDYTNKVLTHNRINADIFTGFSYELMQEPPDGYEVNNWGDNTNVLVKKDRHRDAPESEMKYILMWNDAYGVREYDIGHGREPFYKYKCPETRCVATANRTYLPSVDQFDAVLIHQRSFDWQDLPKKRSPKQRWIHWCVEAAQYVYMDIHELDGIFNWTMTYKRTSDFYLPYGRFHKITDHPEGDELKKYIKEFGRKNKHLAAGRKDFKAAWFVSHCATQSRRERYARLMKKHMDIDIFGRCGKKECPRNNETACYINMEKEYKFYLSFENSICDDYVTEKYFNILKYNVIPITYGGADLEDMGAPIHTRIDALKYQTAEKMVTYLKALHENDEKYAEYFWWKDFYEIRNTMADRAQAYCDLCQKLHEPEQKPKVYENMSRWWISESHCKTLKASRWF